ncbi:uncharacterized protein LOC120644271 [Panicum virgatum]|uniref:uncharacterized protein LOC120644271 n=1 Tax=Panicum virgatum TaxID=38727 RepID=UPI0019D674B4|nr:uncharacterized protein LOC120644271 [Panicum virgatum]
MMRYAPDDTNTEEKKQFWFLRGLHHGIRQVVAGCEFPTLRHMVNRCIAIEREGLDWEDRQRNKRKFESQSRDRNASHFRPRNSFRSGFNQPNANFGNGNNHYSSNRINGGQNQGEASYPRQQPAQEPNTPFAPIVYFACHKVGHKAAYCPEKKKNRTPGPASESATKPVEASRTANRGRLTHLTAREARDASYAMTGPAAEEKTDDQDYKESQEFYEEHPGSHPSMT